MAHQVIPAAQLVPRYHSIGRCKNYDVLQSIPCSPEYKIVGKVLLDHPLSYALTATADVPIVYLQQFWRTVSKVHDTKDTIKFMMDTEEFTYIVDMVGYQGVVDKVSAIYTKNLAQPWQTMFKVFNRYLTTRTSGHDQTKINILQLFHAMINRINVDYVALLWIEEDYHSIKDDIPLVSMYTTRNVLVQWMLIPDEFLTEEIHATDDFKEYEMVFVSKGEKDEQTYVDVDESDNRLEPGSHKEYPEYVDDDDKEEEKVDEKKDGEMSSLKIGTEKMQTLIPTTLRSPRINLY
ncbi:hypothetical protein Tco_0865178 [Tanacetum coccineum]